MTSRPLTVGISAAFDTACTVHARTFLRAVAQFRNTSAAAGVSFVFADDHACQEGGHEAAQCLLAQKIDVVVGHFSSDAARPAIQRYAAANIPVLLPAATMTDLTRHAENVFRVCPHDDVLAARVRTLAQSNGWRRITLSTDDSAHGKALGAAIAAALAVAEITIVSTPVDIDALIFAGRLKASNRYLQSVRSEGFRQPIVLTDDAARSAVLEGVVDAGCVTVVGFADASVAPQGKSFVNQYWRTYGSEPDVYFIESIAALQIAIAAGRAEAPIAALQTSSFDTVFGTVSFVNGERANSSPALWCARGDRLQMSES